MEKRGRRRRGGRGPRNPQQDRTQHLGRSTQELSRPDSDLSDAVMEVSKPQLSEPVPEDTPRFADLAGRDLIHPVLIQTITEDLKFDRMMPVQAATLTELLPPNRSDCLVQAKTGTGKTIAFLLPALQTMISRNRGPDSGISLLVISPTRELAMQIGEEARGLLQRLPRYRTCIAIGGTSKQREEKQILGGCDILIATPGRLLDHMSNEEVQLKFRQLDTLVLDEADRLLDMGFLPALKDIVKHLPDRKEKERQGMLFSATLGSHMDKVSGLVLGPEHKFISTIPAGEANTHERVPQLLITVPTFSLVAPAMVGSIYEEMALVGKDIFKAIVFAPTAALADFYGIILSELPGLPPASILHSRISQSKRTKVTNEYRDAKAAILVATDVVARGMDFPNVTTVFQVGIPVEKQSYIHRIGRTARASAEGRGIFVICEDEAWFPKWTLKDISFVAHNADFSSADKVSAIAERIDENEKAKIYQAWLGYYKNHLKGLRWDNVQLVAQGNTYARDALFAPETPPIAKSIAGKMGLRGTKGLVVIPDPPKQGRGPGRGGRGGRGQQRGGRE